MDVTPAETVERQEAVLRRFDLPLACPDVDLNAVEAAMTLDKKAEGDSLRWVLLEEVGRSTVRGDVPHDVVRQALLRLREDSH